MRLWTLHPKYLDRAGLGATWREGLGAIRVMEALERGESPGYANHSQLRCFRLAGYYTLVAYMEFVLIEARTRGYNYNRGLLPEASSLYERAWTTSGQVNLEARHLGMKLFARRGVPRVPLPASVRPAVNPVFIVVTGDPDREKKS